MSASYRVDKSSGGAVIFAPNPGARALAKIESTESAINSNFSRIESSIDDTVSRIESLERKLMKQRKIEQYKLLKGGSLH